MLHSYGAKVLAVGVTVKAVLMAAILTLLADAAFWQSIVIALVSATATGVFAVLVVVIQIHSERTLHDRIDRLERQTKTAVQTKLDEQTRTIVETVAAEKTA